MLHGQVTTQLLFIQWLDNFQAHARMALPPADPGRIWAGENRRLPGVTVGCGRPTALVCFDGIKMNDIMMWVNIL